MIRSGSGDRASGRRRSDLRVTFIAWTRFDRRSDLLARHLGATMHFISVGRRGWVVDAPRRYVAQSMRTWRVLGAERPDVILVQNPPVFCVLVVFLYCRLHGAEYVIDSHTSAFLSTRWRPFLWMHRVLSASAAATLVHNDAQGMTVKAWECRYLIVPDPVGGYPEGEAATLEGQFKVAVVCTFAEDEPIGVVLKAAEALREIHFYLTGDLNVAPRNLPERCPANAHFTGFMPYEGYLSVLRGADAIVDLTTREDTLLCGAYEAVSLGKPVVVSDWPLLKRRFYRGVVHVKNTVEGVCDGLRQVMSDGGAMTIEVERLRSELESEWARSLGELNSLMAELSEGLSIERDVRAK
jgi:glycosyltransferase involved in cell wall biosynthesis